MAICDCYNQCEVKWTEFEIDLEIDSLDVFELID